MKKFEFITVKESDLRKKDDYVNSITYGKGCIEANEILKSNADHIKELDLYSKLVEDGWELVSVTETYEFGVKYHFKREIEYEKESNDKRRL